MDKRDSAAVVTVTAGCIGGALLCGVFFVRWVAVSPTVAFESAFWGDVVVALFLIPVFGSLYAAPVTLVVLPVVRRLLPGQDRVSLAVHLLAGLISGFLSTVAIAIATVHAEYPAAIGLGFVGAFSGLMAAILLFRLTRAAQPD